MLNWRRDPDYERRMHALAMEIEQIEKETEQLRRENKQLHELESKLDALLLSPDSSCSTPPETDCS
jgi:hypothetical protein